MDTKDTAQISKYTRTLIAVKARQLIGQYGLTPCDREDIEQELAIAVLEAASAWDATRGSRNTYDNRIVNRKVVTIIRYRTRECRDYRRDGSPLEEVVRDEDGAPGSLGAMLTDDADRRLGGTAANEERIDLASDVRAAVNLLGPDLQRLCILLAAGTKADAAQEVGVSKPTIFKRCRAIREHFAELGLEDYVNPGADGLTGHGVCDQ